MLWFHFKGLDEDKRAAEILKDIDSMRISASFKDPEGERVNAELLLLSHYSPLNHHVKVSTSTVNAKVIFFIFILL